VRQPSAPGPRALVGTWTLSSVERLVSGSAPVAQPLARNEYVTRISIDGVVSRSVRDTAAVYDYLSRVPNGGSFIKMGAPAGSYLDAIAREPGKLKIGLSTARWGRGTDTDPEVAARVREAARLLESLGHAVEELNDDAICDWETMWATYATQWISSRSLSRRSSGLSVISRS
jgi:amidase